MKTITIIACIACMALYSACEQKTNSKAPEIVKEAIRAREAFQCNGMPLPATTSLPTACAMYLEAWIDYENARFNSAGSKFLQAAADDPDFAMAHLMASLSALSTEKFAANLKLASLHQASATRGEQLLIEGFEKALASDAVGWIASMQEVTKLHPDSPRAWVFLGNALGNVNNAIDARAAYGKAIELDPGLVSGHINLGNNLLTQDPKDFAKAEQRFMHAVAITPKEPNPHDLLGDVHRAQNNLTAAYQDYTRAAELAPELGSGFQQRGHVNSFLGNYAEARADYARAAKLEDARGSNGGGFFMIYHAYVNVHEGNIPGAIAELQALSAGAEQAYSEGVIDLQRNALTNAALFATEAGDNDTASAIIAEVAALMRKQADEIGSDELRDAQEANISFMQGLLAARMGDTAAATSKAEEFERFAASSSNPRKLERMHEVLGMSAYYQNDFAAAVEHLSAGNLLNNMYTKYYLARANEAAGNQGEAARLYTELSVWNFNGPGFALFRKDILARVTSD